MSAMEFEANCLTTGIGSVPWTDAAVACEQVLAHADIPYWPQLYRRSFNESLPQFFEGFPGLVVEGESLVIDSDLFARELEPFYQKIIDFESRGTLEGFAISEGYAPGLHHFVELKDRLQAAKAVKGQIVGPVSFGLSVTASDGRPMIYDETMREALVRNLQMKAVYQERLLRTVNPDTMIFIDESSLDRIYSPFIGYDEAQARQDLAAILAAIKGLKGVHCCTNTNWPFLLEMIDVISFDAFRYSGEFMMHHAAIKKFLERGGVITWGIVPASEDVFHETAAGLANRLEAVFQSLYSLGIGQAAVLKNSLVTPVCGLGTGSVQTALRAFELTKEVSALLRREYSLR